MIQLDCPFCKARVQTAEDFAGKALLCPGCQQSLSVPALASAITAAGPVANASGSFGTAVTTPELAEAAQRGKREIDGEFDDRVPNLRREVTSHWLRVWLPVVIVVLVVATPTALLVPAVQRVRESAARTQAVNNLKGIGLGIHGFHDAHKRLPFNGSHLAAGNVDYSRMARANSFESGSWAFQIAPYIDQGLLFANPAGAHEGIWGLVCPGRGRPKTDDLGRPWSDYHLNNYLNDPLQAEKPDAPDMRRTIAGITDGTANTVLVGNGSIRPADYSKNRDVPGSSTILIGGTVGTMRSGNKGVIAPRGVISQRDSNDIVPGHANWGSTWRQGCLFSMGDATIRMFPYDMNNLSSFLTPTAGEAVVLPEA